MANIKKLKSIFLPAIFLLFQAGYLSTLLLDKDYKTSEIWMFLALSYIPLVVLFGLAILAYYTLSYAKNKDKKLLIMNVLAFLLYCAMSYFVLRWWGLIFNLPL